MPGTLDGLARRRLIFLHDLLAAPLAWFLAFLLRFDLGAIPERERAALLWSLPVVLLIQILVVRALRLDRAVWRFSSTLDLYRLSRAVLLSLTGVSLALFALTRLEGVPRSVLPLYAVLLLLITGGSRFAYRFWRDYARSSPARPQGQRALVVGAGSAGELLVRDLLVREKGAIYWPVAFVDDDTEKHRRTIHDLRVVGTCQEIPQFVRDLDIAVLLIAAPSVTDAQMQRLVALCEQAAVPFLTLPSVTALISGQVGRSVLRPVAIEDLLGRAPVRLEWDAMRAHLSGKTVLVSGGGGSIGAELCAQLACLPIARLVVFEKNEFNLYRIAQRLDKIATNCAVTALLGDVTDAAAVRQVLAHHRPDVVFHAAAYKHVPLLETQVREALRTNLLGTHILAQAACDVGVGEFVLISTDKAVRPTNVMGASKRAAERVVQCLNRRGSTRFITVRFGNVLDSAGSVVPLFREQIQSGGPVTVTHPDITRYFMTIPEACQLILEAASVGEGGEVFVLDMGEPVAIRELAEQMIRLSGKRPYADIPIIFVGLRPGEKLHEELFHDEDALTTTAYQKLRLARPAPQDWGLIAPLIEQVAEDCASFDEAGLMEALRALVPDFMPERKAASTADRSSVSP